MNKNTETHPNKTARVALTLGALNMALVITIGAFGAHALKATLSNYAMTLYQTALQYHTYHALGLILIGILSATHIASPKPLTLSVWAMGIGIILFSGSLYILALTNIKWLGAITPLGGAGFILAWLLVAWAMIRASMRRG